MLAGDLCKKNSFIAIFSQFFLVSYDFIKYGDFTYIAASNRASDDVTK